MSGLPVLGGASVCARCAAAGPTCCEPEPGLPLAALTPGDIRRIATETGLAPSAFTATRSVDEAERSFLHRDDRLLSLLVRDGRLTSLSKTGRACVFHRADTGCSLRYDVRPVLCRRFPIVRQGRFLNVRPGGRCLAVEEASDMSQLLHLLGLPETELEAIEQILVADLRS